MTALNTFAPLVARIFFGLLFLGAGAGKLADPAGFTGYLTSGGLPAFLAWPSILFELVVGLGLIAGFQTRILALLGAGFCVATALLYHFQPADQIQMTMFFKNFAIAGGLVLLAAHGAGRYAVDKTA